MGREDKKTLGAERWLQDAGRKRWEQDAGRRTLGEVQRSPAADAAFVPTIAPAVALAFSCQIYRKFMMTKLFEVHKKIKSKLLELVWF